MAYELVWEAQGIHKLLSGFVSADEFIKSVDAVQGHPRFNEMRYVINDFSNVTGHGLTEDLLLRLEALHYGAHATNPRCRIFFVTKDEELANLVNKHLVESRLVGYEVVVTSTVAQAHLWIETQPVIFRLSPRHGNRIDLAG